MSKQRNTELEGRISMLERKLETQNMTHITMLEAELKKNAESNKKLQAQLAASEQVCKSRSVVDTLSCQHCFSHGANAL